MGDQAQVKTNMAVKGKYTEFIQKELNTEV